MLAPARLSLLVVLASMFSCTDTGVVGAGLDCVPSCSQGTVCEPKGLTCVECNADTDCKGKDDGQKPRCDSVKAKCVECRDQQDCQSAQPFCVDGECKKSANSDDHGDPGRSKGDGGTS